MTDFEWISGKIERREGWRQESYRRGRNKSAQREIEVLERAQALQPDDAFPCRGGQLSERASTDVQMN